MPRWNNTASPRHAPCWSPAVSTSSPAARRYFPDQPVILKPNRGGKGLGVQLFASSDSLAAFVESDAWQPPVDGLHLLQEYVRAPRPVITRAEFVGGRFLYAVEVDTSDGFELCPADACAIGDANCPVGEAPPRRNSPSSTASRTRCASGWSVSSRLRHRGGRHRVHLRCRRTDAGLRREHQYELQSRRRGTGGPHRHGPLRPWCDRCVPRRGTGTRSCRGRSSRGAPAARMRFVTDQLRQPGTYPSPLP